MENCTKCEDTEVNALPANSQMNQASYETKSVVDNKNTQVRVVRGTKKLKIDNDLVNIEKKDVKDEDATEAKVKSLKRSCELWSLEDKNTFFKALNEYGKDFDALQSYFLSQGKKRGLSDAVIKNKEQIRHFYYRTWLKISKHLKFSEDVKKTTQELYGLINYGELRRKLPRIHEKVHLRLNELVYWGSTQVRLKGKTIRIKTPICRTLRKLNQLEDWQEEIKLPSRITIELRPRNNMAWWQVQAVSMNPRVRTLLPMQRRLSSFLIFLQQRWRLTKYTCSTENLIANDIKDTCLLRVAPVEGCKISLPMINLGEYLTSSSVSLNSYEKRLGLKSSKLDLLGSVQHLKGVGKKGIKRSKLDKKVVSRADENCTLPDVNSDVDLLETGSNVSEKLVTTNNTEKLSPENTSEPNRFPGRETIERIRKGWNIEEANTITVGDLFLMFGRESKITLEYWWDWVQNEQYTSDSASSSIVRDDSLCLILQKLLSLAKHNYGTNKVYDNTSGSNETVISSRVPSIKDSTFRRPLIPQTYPKISTADAFKTQLDKFKTRFCKRGRTVRQKSLVIQRVLPIISAPNMLSENFKTDANKSDAPSLCQTQTDKIIAGDVSEAQEKTFLEALETSGDAKNTNSIITSATQILKEGEHQWLNSEVADFSLSSFLGQLESPMKGSQRSQAGEQIIDDARPSSDVVSHMQCLMGENSVDYMTKFANFASQLTSNENKK